VDDDIRGAVDSELVFIGACLTRPDILYDTTITGDDFENPTLGKMFDRMLVRQNQQLGVSQALLSEDFPQQMRQIWASTDNFTEMALAPHHEQQIRDRSVRRKLKFAAVRIAAIADGNEMDSIVDRARAEVDAALRGDETRAVSMMQDAAAVLADYRTEVDLVPSPWRRLNEIIGGFAPGRMYVVGARPGVGKSAVAAQIAYELAGRGPVVFATMEMSKGEMYSRIISQQAGISYGTHSGDSPQFMKDMERNWLDTQVRDIRVIDHGTQSVASIRSAARSAARDGKLSGVVVDYIHLLTGPGNNEVDRIANITRGLKQLSMDLKVPVIALSQLNRAVTSRESGKPGLGDLRSSGSIEQDGDCVIFLYKDIGVEETTPNKTINVYVAKNRQGESFVGFTLRWEGIFMRAEDDV
jgi:replicative DNA helicase